MVLFSTLFSSFRQKDFSKFSLSFWMPSMARNCPLPLYLTASKINLTIDFIFNFLSQVVGLDFNDPVNKAKVLVHRLSSPIKLTFNIGIVSKDTNISCRFFNETIKAWLTTGMKAVAPVGGDLVCESTHATFFGPFSQSLSNRTNTTSTPITTVGGEF